MDFQGFQTVVPVWVMLLLALLAAGLAWYSYANVSSLKTHQKIGFATLRSLAIFLVLFLLLDPFYRQFLQRTERPTVDVYLDNSRSTGIEKGDYNGKNSYQDVIDALNIKSEAGIRYNVYTIGIEIKPSTLSELDFNQPETNLFSFTEIAKESRSNAAILVSDGIYTIGRDPQFNLAAVNMPVFVVGLGDTTRVQDVVVRNVDVAPTGYVDTAQPIEADIEHRGFGGRTVKVILKKGADIVNEQSVTLPRNDGSATVTFSEVLQETGLQTFSVEVQPLAGEWSASNNSRVFSIDVLDSKVKVFHASFEVHPDVGMIRDILRTDENIRLTTFTWLGGTRTVERKNIPPADSIDLLIVHGIPANQSIIEQINNRAAAVPTLFMNTPGSSRTGISFNAVPYALIEQGTNLSSVNFIASLGRDQHPILELPLITPANLLPIYTPIRRNRLSSGATALFNVLYQGVETVEPVIAIQELSTVRRVHVNSMGWYRLYQSSTGSDREYVKTLFSNIVSWASTDPDNRKLKVEPERRVFESSDEIVIHAFLVNESGQPESDARVDIQISRENEQPKSYSFENRSGGNYSLRIPNSGEGFYSFKAEAKKGGRVIDTQNGEFLVNTTNSEQINTIQNLELLQSIAAQTGGAYYSHLNASEVIQDINQAGLLESRLVSEEKFNYPVRSPIWFVVLMLLLGTEWLLRKIASLP